MKIEMTAEEFRSFAQSNEAMTNKVIDLSTRLNSTAATLQKTTNDLYTEQNKRQDAEYNRDQFKAQRDALQKQIDDPNTGWVAANARLLSQIDALNGKSAVPIAALKNFIAIAMGNPSDKKAAIAALKELTLQSVKDATALWDEMTTAALQQRKL